MSETASVAAREGVEAARRILEPPFAHGVGGLMRDAEIVARALLSHTDSIRAEERERCARVVEDFEARLNFKASKAAIRVVVNRIRSLSPGEETK